MESFLSLPRFAKGGLAVLLAVALLGWGIVAYSSKRQHDDAQSLQTALATLKTKTDAEDEATTKLAGLREQLTSIEVDLAASQQIAADAEAQTAEIESNLNSRNESFATLEAELAALKTAAEGEGADDTSESKTAETQALGLTSNMPSDSNAGGDDAVLRGRLTKAMTALSARSATLAQRDRQLERLRVDYESAGARIEELEESLVEQGVLRERLQTTMTALSARSATLAQRDRELERARTDYQAAVVRAEELTSDLAEQGVLRQRLQTVMTTLSARSATLEQRDRELEALRAEQVTAASHLAAFAATEQERDANNDTLARLEIKIDRTKKALADGAEALGVNQEEVAESQARLGELAAETDKAQQSITEKQQQLADKNVELAEIAQTIAAKEQQLDEITATLETRQAEVDDAKAKLADLKMARAEVEAEISSLNAELEQQEAMQTNKADAIAYAETRLQTLESELADAEGRIARSETQLATKLSQIDQRANEVKAVEANLAALKQDRSATTAETIQLQNTLVEQEGALEALQATKSDLDVTKAELAYQRQILKDRQEQVKLADARLDQLQQALSDSSSRGQTFARMPIAAISQDNLAVLPIDPTEEPFPVQTPMGIRLTEVHFDLASAELTPGGLRKAKEAAAWIRKQSVEKVRLVGFTDTIGTKENNMALAGRRAESLLRVFEQEGVDPTKIEIIAKGETGAREVTADQTAEPLNRCVGVFISADG